MNLKYAYKSWYTIESISDKCIYPWKIPVVGLLHREASIISTIQIEDVIANNTVLWLKSKTLRSIRFTLSSNLCSTAFKLCDWESHLTSLLNQVNHAFPRNLYLPLMWLKISPFFHHLSLSLQILYSHIHLFSHFLSSFSICFPSSLSWYIFLML